VENVRNFEEVMAPKKRLYLSREDLSKMCGI